MLACLLIIAGCGEESVGPAPLTETDLVGSWSNDAFKVGFEFRADKSYLRAEDITAEWEGFDEVVLWITGTFSLSGNNLTLNQTAAWDVDMESLDTLWEYGDEEIDDRVFLAATVNGNKLTLTQDDAALILTKE